MEQRNPANILCAYCYGWTRNLKVVPYLISVDGVEFPDLPSFRRRIIQDSKRTDVTPYMETLVVAHETPYVVAGARKLAIRVDKRADQ